MDVEAGEFELPRSRDVYDRFIGMYIEVYTHGDNGNPSLGMLKEIIDGIFILNPHKSIDYETTPPRIELKEGDSTVVMKEIIKINPTTRKSLESYCSLLNNPPIQNSRITILSKIRSFLRRYLPL